MSLLLIVTGPSGVGKDSLLDQLRSLDRPYHFAITATTRPARPGDTDGVHYYFLSPERFQLMLDGDEFLENATVYEFRYGVPKGPIREALARGQDVVMRTDVQGARYIKSVCPQATTVFVKPPSWEELERRLRSRATDSSEQVELRLRIATEELARADEFDHTLVNDDLAAATKRLEAIMTEERTRPRQPIQL